MVFYTSKVLALAIPVFLVLLFHQPHMMCAMEPHPIFPLAHLHLVVLVRMFGLHELVRVTFVNLSRVQMETWAMYVESKLKTWKSIVLPKGQGVGSFLVECIENEVYWVTWTPSSLWWDPWLTPALGFGSIWFCWCLCSSGYIYGLLTKNTPRWSK